MLKGKSVQLRPIQKTDIAYFLVWLNDPDVTQYLVMHLPLTEIAEQKYLDDLAINRAATDAVFVIEAIEGEKKIVIGNLGLHHINGKDQSAALGIVIGDKQYWGKGCGSEAVKLIIRYGFEQLNLHRIASSAWAFNERSIKMHLRAGFKEEGRRKEAVFKNGAFHDEVEFGLLRENWKKNLPKIINV
jgi:RimJ/RimL family protein N-acetyltransferase